MSYLNATNEFVESVVENLIGYLAELASIVEGNVERHATYMDAHDALCDVRALWEDDRAYFAGQAAAAATLTVAG